MVRDLHSSNDCRDGGDGEDGEDGAHQGQVLLPPVDLGQGGSLSAAPSIILGWIIPGVAAMSINEA